MGARHLALPHATAAGARSLSAQREAPRYAVIFDGGCTVCRSFVERLRKWDRDGVLEFAESRHPGVGVRFPWISPAAFDESVQLVRISDALTWQGAAALEELLKILPRGRAFRWLFRLPLARDLSERLYRLFAKNRHRLGCTEHCRTT